jgi:hypothetical protein
LKRWSPNLPTLFENPARRRGYFQKQIVGVGQPAAFFEGVFLNERPTAGLSVNFQKRGTPVGCL